MLSPNTHTSIYNLIVTPRFLLVTYLLSNNWHCEYTNIPSFLFNQLIGVTLGVFVTMLCLAIRHRLKKIQQKYQSIVTLVITTLLS